MAHRNSIQRSWGNHDNNSTSSSESDESPAPPPTKRLSKEKSKKKGKGTSKKARSQTSEDSSEVKNDVHEEFLAAARAITCCIDMCCKVDDVINITLLLEQEEAAKSGDLMEDEHLMAARTARLLSMFFHLITMMAAVTPRPVHEPSKDTITPPIANGSGGRSHLGLSHAVLAGFIIPVDYLQLYEDDPVSTLKEIEGGRLDMDADHFPVVLWSGNPPSADYDPDNMQDGLFRGYLLV
ncbi:hypothetical protein BDN67DRAFT_982208 [Paxillus ammoniavirescens]|nr:hypothetical protein BDN67DRAFT_982208 [Paxillus ammoniavirescens]